MEHLILVVALIAGVHGVCDRNKVQSCLDALTQAQGSDINAQCQAFAGFKLCIDADNIRVDCAGDPIMQSVSMMESTIGPVCTGSTGTGTQGCSGMLQCLVHIQGLVSEEFQGYPTAVQLNAGCPKVQEFKTCIDPIIKACEKDSSEQSKLVVKSLNMASDLSSFMCGKYKDDFLKYGSECFEKQAYTTATQSCYKTTNTDPNATPSPQTQEEQCKEMSKQFNCLKENTKGTCSAEAVEFVSKVESEFFNILGENMGCPINGAIKMEVQMWVYLGLLLAAVFFF